MIINPTPVMGARDVAEGSSSLSVESVTHLEYKEVRLKSFLESYNSPLSDYAGDFVETSEKYGLDWRLLASIAGVESTFGKRIPTNSYNAYGWANGQYSFESWEDSIDHVSKILRTRYIDRGADDIYKIGRIYAPPSPTWAVKVNHFMSKIDPIPLEFSL